ncbi:unknown [Prevotella sp. CAG:924]|nr:unknown [Prevotella sp. CAG:924]
MAGKTTDILNIGGSVSLNVSDKSKGPGTCVSAPVFVV